MPPTVDPALRLILLTGNTGAGKSTIARGLLGKLGEGWKLLTWDDFIGPAFDVARLAGGFPPGTSQDEKRRAVQTRFVSQAVSFYMRTNGYSVVVEGHLRDSSELVVVASGAGLALTDSAVRVLQLACSEESCVARRKLDPRWEGAVRGLGDSAARGLWQGHPVQRWGGARVVETDGVPPEVVLERAWRELS